MLRGVNKRLIEVNDTGSDVFEKALFIVKDGSALNRAELQKEAQRVMVSYFSEDGRPHQGFLRYTDRRKKRRRLVLAVALCSVVLCIGIPLILNILL